MSEDAHALYVTALAPGLDPAAVQVTVQDDRLTIAGEKQRAAADIQPEAFHRSERAAGKFVRTVTLPIDVLMPWSTYEPVPWIVKTSTGVPSSRML